ncbi:hypothetical protein BN12_1380007 [Nostocoides japonicum T1-X7]|uniref:Uncharacterized protein n=1 Tax=Nostocoides japonicum T1-X7 TaxID=1194083 RepID=A0A077LXD1_9MICO|nr:hypothetical protein BN12_1380007 [Tetrasphaera japonica T1-X7]
MGRCAMSTFFFLLAGDRYLTPARAGPTGGRATSVRGPCPGGPVCREEPPGIRPRCQFLL